MVLNRVRLQPALWGLCALGAALWVVVAWVAYHYLAGPHYPPERVAAWEKVSGHVEDANAAYIQAAEEHCQRVKAFIAERKLRARAFGQKALGWRSKLHFVLEYVPGVQGDHKGFLRACFESTVCSSSDIQEALKGVVADYARALAAIDNDLLVKARADLADGDIPELLPDGHLGTLEAFREEYRKALDAVAAVVAKDVGATAGKEVVTWVGADVAAGVGVSLAAGAAESLGLSAGVLGAGAASSTVSLGIGAAAAIAIDAILDKILLSMGYNPALQIEMEVERALGRLEKLLLDGEKEPEWSLLVFLRLEEQKPHFRGLKAELARVGGVREKLRTAALKRLILEGGR